MTVDGQLESVSRCTVQASPSLTNLQIEVLDTAGAEQFTSLNEVYMKVTFDIFHASLVAEI